jgi:hypothetical protein
VYTFNADINSVATYIPFSTANTGITWDSQNLTFATTTSGDIVLTPAGSTTTSRSFQHKQGADLTAANNLVPGLDGDKFEVTGATEIQLIANTGRQNGSQITLLFASTPTVKHNTATSGANITIQLAGSADFSATAGDLLVLELLESGGTQMWRESTRSAN